MKKICVVGTGYVGLVSGACLADFGNAVICADIDEDKIDKLNRGIIPIYEPGLQEVVERNVQKKRLSFSSSVDESIRESEVIFIAVGTPPGSKGEADLSIVFKVAESIARNLHDYKVVVTKSTVPAGTGRKVWNILKEKASPGSEFDVVSNPEFLREGSAVGDFLRPDRVVIGSDSDRATEVMKMVYRALYINETPMVITNIETSEMIKYASNAFLAVKISYINEIANICDRIGADVKTVARAMGLDGRISPKFLHAGGGYGGSCFPKDTKALVKTSDDVGIPNLVVTAAIEANEKQKYLMVDKIKTMVGNLKGKTIALLGLAFKPNTDDIREATSLVIVDEILKAGGSVRAYDPVAMDIYKSVFSDITYCKDVYDCVAGADCMVLVTEWNEFREMDLHRAKSLLKHPHLVDCRNIYDVEEVQKIGFKYVGVGRGSKNQFVGAK
ncbi:MAG: UDP-glucose/GDP-mannose dehydrogenase family protein [Bacteroidetes bacterium]|nr:UDP-glucose/GDP-mannose dehydrogenase family protein [Bacteroidota bacterium]